MINYSRDIVNEILVNKLIVNNYTRFRAWLELLLVKKRLKNILEIIIKDRLNFKSYYSQDGVLFDPKVSQIVEAIDLLSHKIFQCNFTRQYYTEEYHFPLQMKNVLSCIELMKLSEKQDFRASPGSSVVPEKSEENDLLKKANQILENRNQSLTTDNIKLQEKILNLKIEMSLVHEQYLRQLRAQGLSVKTFKYSLKGQLSGKNTEADIKKTCKLLVPDSLLIDKNNSDSPNDPRVEDIIVGVDALEMSNDDEEVALDVTDLNENFEPKSPPIIGPKLHLSKSLPKSFHRVSIQKLSDDDKNYEVSHFMNATCDDVKLNSYSHQNESGKSTVSTSVPANGLFGMEVVRCKRKLSRYGMPKKQTKIDKSSAMRLLTKDVHLHSDQPLEGSTQDFFSEISNYYTNVSCPNISLPTSISERLKCQEENIGMSGKRIVSLIKSGENLRNKNNVSAVNSDVNSEATDYDIEEIINESANNNTNTFSYNYSYEEFT